MKFQFKQAGQLSTEDDDLEAGMTVAWSKSSRLGEPSRDGGRFLRAYHYQPLSSRQPGQEKEPGCH